MNAAALTALVDRWRPETHTFHLRAGEMTPTLQDVSMILGLPIQGEPLCMNTASDGWRQRRRLLAGLLRCQQNQRRGLPPAHLSLGLGLTLDNARKGPTRTLSGRTPACTYGNSESKHTSGKKQAPRSAYQLKPRGKAPNRYTPEDYVNRGKKVVIEEDEGPPRRSSLSRMRNDEPLSSEEEEQEEQEEQQQQEPRQRTKRMAVRKQPVRTARRGRH
ncbi:hypothetical protein QYE76_027646 [Lolium multiflorum]|uniref:Aminotransferase-like plant mobile domain-containing protein n=1 Tax=Lolium multiflorum TaxID=4521 RepID=A0AAD8QN16_LOLMU|nr:hypothetical protein QYE76_027646 [Lolium multiflorum]